LNTSTLEISDGTKSYAIDGTGGDLIYGYSIAIEDGIRLLLVQIYRRVHSQKDSQILYTRVMELMIKVMELMIKVSRHLSGHRAPQDEIKDIESYIDNLKPVMKPIMKPNKKALMFDKSKLELLFGSSRSLLSLI
jgi:hypothetical protein